MKCCVSVNYNCGELKNFVSTISKKTYIKNDCTYCFVLTGNNRQDLIKNIFILGTEFSIYRANVILYADLLGFENNISDMNDLYIFKINFGSQNKLNDAIGWWKQYPINPIDCLLYDSIHFNQTGISMHFTGTFWKSYVNLIFFIGRYYYQIIPFPTFDDIIMDMEVSYQQGLGS